MKRIIAISTFVVVILFAAASVVHANDFGLGQTARSAGLDTKVTDIPTLIGNIIGTGLSLVGIAFFVLTIYGGFLWMTAHGNDEQIKRALKIIASSVIGLVIIMAAYAITNFVFTSLNPGGRGATGQPGSGNGDGQQQVACCVIPDSAGIDNFFDMSAQQDPQTACVARCESQGIQELDCGTQARVVTVNPGDCSA